MDYQDFLRQGRLPLWDKDDPRSQAVRRLAYATPRSAKSYEPLCRSAETAANTLVCLIHQANFLLDRQLRGLDARFQKEGGFTEKLYRTRMGHRGPIGPMGKVSELRPAQQSPLPTPKTPPPRRPIT